MRNIKAIPLIVLLACSGVAVEAHAWSLFTSKEEQARLAKLEAERLAEERRAAWLKSMHEKLQKEVEGTPFTVELRENGVAVTAPVKGSFNPDRPKMLLSSMLPPLSRLAKFIAAEENATLVVMGQADKPDSVDSVQGLANDRAMSVASIFRLSGMKGDRMRARGMKFEEGQKELDAKGFVASRRIEMLLVHREKFVAQLLSYNK